MLIEFNEIKEKYSVGLRWAVDTKPGIELLQYNFNLNYGFMMDLPGNEKNPLKMVALSDEEHDRTFALAGLFAKRFENLILVHRVNEHVYWLCVIKNHEVWMGYDVAQATAGDFIGGVQSVREVMEAAKEEFEAEDISLEGIFLCTDTAWSEFQSLENTNFIELIVSMAKFRRQFEVRYLEPSKVVVQKVVLAIIVIGAILWVGYYFYRQRDLNHLKELRVEQERQAKLAKERAAKKYFDSLLGVLKKQWGYNVIETLMAHFSHLPLQSHGWEFESAVYKVETPNRMNINLVRSSYGTVDTFIYAYSPEGDRGLLSKSNDKGTKTVDFPEYETTFMSTELTQKELTVTIPRERFRLISYMQLSTDMYKFQLVKQSVSKYKIPSATFVLSGSSLWQLSAAKEMFKTFPTVTIQEVNLTAKDYDMSWQLEGTVYA